MINTCTATRAVQCSIFKIIIISNASLIFQPFGNIQIYLMQSEKQNFWEPFKKIIFALKCLLFFIRKLFVQNQTDTKK